MSDQESDQEWMRYSWFLFKACVVCNCGFFKKVICGFLATATIEKNVGKNYTFQAVKIDSFSLSLKKLGSVVSRTCHFW